MIQAKRAKTGLMPPVQFHFSGDSPTFSPINANQYSHSVFPAKAGIRDLKKSCETQGSGDPAFTGLTATNRPGKEAIYMSPAAIPVVTGYHPSLRATGSTSDARCSITRMQASMPSTRKS